VIITSLLSVFFVILSIAGLLLFIFGFQKKTQLSILLGGVAVFTAIFYFIGWIFLVPFAPPIALAISFLGRKKESSA